MGMSEIAVEARDRMLTRYPSPIYEGEKALAETILKNELKP